MTLLTPALVPLAVAVAIAWLTVPGLFTPILQEAGPSLSVVDMSSTGQWEAEPLSAPERTDNAGCDASRILPDGYHEQMAEPSEACGKPSLPHQKE
jgi:hypothetical protein